MASTVNRLAGRYAVCQFAHTSAIVNLTAWEVRIRTDFVDGTGFGDFWDIPVPIKYLWTARARGRFSGLVSYLNAFGAAQPGNADVVATSFVGYIDDIPSVKIFAASGYVEAASFAAAQGSMVEQEIEIRGLSNPTLIT